MAQVLSLSPCILKKTLRDQSISTRSQLNPTRSWDCLQQTLKCKGRFSCLFSDNRKQEQARKALESALGEKKMEFEKWDKELKKREEAGGGGNSGGGGWFRWGRWFGGSDEGHFWQEAQQAALTILGIVVVYLIVVKGDVLLAVIFNPLLFVLRGTRAGLTFLASKVTNKANSSSHANSGFIHHQESTTPISARERVVGKWGSD